jgi:hypothetical protein
MLKARDVWDEQEERRERRMSAMRPVLAQLYAKIRAQAIHNPNAPYVVFEVPNFVFGYPLFQVSEAREYLTKTLTESGFLVWPVNDDKYLLVSWLRTQQRASHRPPLLTTYRPQVYDPSVMNSMYRS